MAVDPKDPSSERTGRATDRGEGPDTEQSVGRRGMAVPGRRSRRRAVGPRGAALGDGEASYAPLAVGALDRTESALTATGRRAEPDSADDRLADDLPPHYDRGV